MLKEYRIEHWNKDNQKVGKRIFAQSFIDARLEAEKDTDFKALSKCEEIK